MTAPRDGLAGKNVLFIAPRFFGYEKLIKGRLESRGASVDFYADRPGADFWTKALIRVNRKLLARKVNRYYDAIIGETRGKRYDYILIVRGEAISPARVRSLRAAHPDARTALYLWDSMHYNPNARVIAPLFDDVFSFDRSDVDTHPGMSFLPLFYASAYERAVGWTGDTRYDACFIGTIHTDRYKVLERTLERLERDGRRVFVFCYYPSRVLCGLRSLVDPGFRRFAKRRVSFEGMPLDEVVERICESRTIIDINRPNQLGLTIRSLEAVGAQRRLITTNADIVNYDIYSQSGVLLLDRAEPVVPDAFFQGSDAPFDEDVRSKYSIDQWLTSIFEVSDRRAVDTYSG